MQDSASNEDLSSCIKETNEGLNDDNDITFTVENLQPLLLGQFKASDYNTPQFFFTRTNLYREINN